MPEKTYASKSAGQTVTPRRVSKPPAAGRDTSDDFARPASKQTRRSAAAGDDDGYTRAHGQRFTGLRFRLKGGVPSSVAGRIAAGVVVLTGLVGFTAVLWAARSSLLHDPRLTIASSASIQIVGNRRLTRPQLLSVFGEDVDRNILTVDLADRKAELEQLPWVEHATVMRLLPNHVRVAIIERVPVAFVRQGGHIGLVDKTGVLLDLSPEAASDNHYSFPVVTGVTADMPISTRAARMKLYQGFLDALDAGKDKISDKLSEVDLSSPEDIKALIPSGTGPDTRDILVHFGDDDFLARYQRFEQRLPEWKQQYPKLASADMRYEREVVLEMAPGNAVPVSEEEKKRVAGAQAVAERGILGGKNKNLPKPTALKPTVKPATKAPTPAAHKPWVKPTVAKPAVAHKPAATKPAATPAPKPYVSPMHIHNPMAVEPQ
ncbi:cell division protein FtsQ/DivIB [Granulicella tundricola]|uniref:cell division protein FtsQ/DivIB n=1 Tax=Granulicella tundricola TaxID=940615 RepID=UPI0012FC9FDD|nr:FtsQ-type POTRA domain-containing protein [Granulicella tundricola]